MRIGAARKSFIAGIMVAVILCTSAHAQQLDQKVGQQFDQKLYSEMRWRCIGPFRGGRTVAISGVPHQPNVFYMAAVNGGVWKTTDFGNTWNPIFDDQPTGSVGALAVAPSDPSIIYVGSGETLRRVMGCTNPPTQEEPGRILVCATHSKSPQSSLTRKIPIAFSSPRKDIRMGRTLSVAFSVPRMADKLSRRFSTKTKTRALPISRSILRIRKQFMRRCGPRV
jgi:hypothetical protein